MGKAASTAASGARRSEEVAQAGKRGELLEGKRREGEGEGASNAGGIEGGCNEARIEVETGGGGDEEAGATVDETVKEGRGRGSACAGSEAEGGGGGKGRKNKEEVEEEDTLRQKRELLTQEL